MYTVFEPIIEKIKEKYEIVYTNRDSRITVFDKRLD